MDSNITLDAVTKTYDPDNPNAPKEEFHFIWMCRRECENYPEYDINWNITQEMNKTCEFYGGSRDVGCFYGDGVNSSGMLNVINCQDSVSYKAWLLSS